MTEVVPGGEAELELGAPVRAVPRALKALGHREFRLFWAGAVFSNVGAHMQLAAVGWVVAVQTHSAARVSAVAFAGLIPLLALSPLGGALADRFPRRRVLMAAQVAQMTQAFTLFALWEAGLASFWVLFVLALANGAMGALNAPAWQAFVPELVPRSSLANAVMLNSTQFNIARAVGPLLAGFTIARFGAGVSFLYNAVSYAGVLAALSLMSGEAEARGGDRPGWWREFVEGVRYARSQPGVVVTIGTMGLVALCGAPILSLIPIVALKSYSAGAESYGLLAGAFGIGAVVGAFVLGTVDGRVPFSRIAGTGLGFYSAAILGLAAAPTLGTGIVAMACVGGGFLTVAATFNSAVQTLAEDRMRGRVLSLWLMMFGTAAPTGTLSQGFLADAWGPKAVIALDGTILGAYLAFLLARRLLPRIDGG